MTIRQLEYFCAVAEEKSVSAAARRLHVAQPPISRQIGLLEHELRAALFRRGSKGMALTEAGESLYRQGRHYLEEMDRLKEQVRALGVGVRGTVRTGLLYSTAPYALPFLRAYRRAYPEVELRIRVGSPQDLIAELNRGGLHALFLRGGARESPGLHERILGTDELKLITTAATDPAPELDAVPIDRLRATPMCLLRSDDLWGYNDALVRECQRCGFTPTVACECYDTPTTMQLVRSGFGVSFLPESIVDTLPGSGVYAKAVQGLAERSHVVLVWSGNAEQSASVEAFTGFKFT